MRAIGIDVHRDFCEVAVSEGGHLRSAGLVLSTPEELELLGASLSDDDEVALEATGNALAIARIIEPHVARVVVASARELHAISDAKAKTDRRDARTLAKLLAAGMLAGTWLPGEETRALRRRLAQRAQLVRARTPETVEALKRQAAQQLEDQDMKGDAWSDSGLVFTKEDGEAWHPEVVSRFFRSAVKVSRLPEIRLHDLRHTHATLALRAGIHPKVVSERLGHATVSITLDTYSHAIPAMQEEAAALIAGLVFDAS